MTIRSMAGQREQSGKVSLFRGPILLAWDQRDNAGDEFRIPRIDPSPAGAVSVAGTPQSSLTACAPWLLVEVPSSRGPIRLRDFATAGMSGTRYRSWLRAASAARNSRSASPWEPGPLVMPARSSSLMGVSRYIRGVLNARSSFCPASNA